MEANSQHLILQAVTAASEAITSITTGSVTTWASLWGVLTRQVEPRGPKDACSGENKLQALEPGC